MADGALLLQVVEESFPVYDKKMEIKTTLNKEVDEEDMGELLFEKTPKSDKNSICDSKQGGNTLECYQKYLKLVNPIWKENDNDT